MGCMDVYIPETVFLNGMNKPWVTSQFHSEKYYSIQEAVKTGLHIIGIIY